MPQMSATHSLNVWGELPRTSIRYSCVSCHTRHVIVCCPACRCGQKFHGGASRIAHHALGLNRMAKCKTTSGNALEIIKEIKEDMDQHQAKKQRAQAVREVNCAAEAIHHTNTTGSLAVNHIANPATDAMCVPLSDAFASLGTPTSNPLLVSEGSLASSGYSMVSSASALQRNFTTSTSNSLTAKSTSNTSGSSAHANKPRQTQLSFMQNNADFVDQAISRFFYGCNIPASIIGHPLFLKMCHALRFAPRDGYRFPDRRALYGPLLEQCVTHSFGLRRSHYVKRS